MPPYDSPTQGEPSENSPQPVQTHEPAPSSAPLPGTNVSSTGYAPQWSYAPQPTAAYTPPQPRMTASAPAEPDFNLIYTNPQEYERQRRAFDDFRFEQRIAAERNQFGGVATSLAERQAMQDRDASKRDPKFASVWERWENEIEAELAGIPLANRNRFLFDKAAGIVRGNHVEELARETAERLFAGGSGSERGTSFAGVSGSAPVGDKLDESYESGHPWFARARSEGVSKQMIREHAAKMRIPVDNFVTNILSENLISTPGGFKRTQSNGY